MDTLKLLAIAAGFLTIGAAAVLAFRQKTIAWQHVAVFSLGAVLAGISGIQLEGDTSKWSVNIGQIGKLADAASQNSAAANEQANALIALGQRLDQLQTTVASLEASRTTGTTAGGSTTPGATDARATALRNDFLARVTRSQELSRSARLNSLAVREAAGISRVAPPGP